MSLPYPTISDNPGSLNSGSYLGGNQFELFSGDNTNDLWFGSSEYDHVEVSIYDLSENLLNWGQFYTDKTFKSVSLTFVNEKDENVSYNYTVLENNFINYKNSQILVNPIDEINYFNLSDGGYLMVYNMVRTMVGGLENSLSIKEISPSRKEIKLIPTKKYDNRFVAFALKKFQVKDVSPLIIQKTKECPYSQIYENVKSEYKDGIDFLKYIFSLGNDNDVIVFLKNMYDDYIKYTSLSSENITLGYEPSQIYRTQGIKTYFQNFLLSSKEDVSDFLDIKSQYNRFVNDAINKRFNKYQNQLNENYRKAREFVYDFFTKNFYSPLIDPLEKIYKDKYESYFCNAINFGNGRLIPFLSHDYINENSSNNESLTIILKFPEELPNDIGVKSSCWITNIDMVPIIAKVLYKVDREIPTIKISPADFTLPIPDVSFTQNNTLYSSDDLEYESSDEENRITINKNISELDIDYSDFENFINFSSAAVRVTVFKNKMIKLAGIVNSLNTLDSEYSSSVSSGGTYPNYLDERSTISNQVDDIINSFDGYESYLYKSGNCQYDVNLNQFSNLEFITTLDNSASDFDKSNADSLINNTPQHIQLDEKNEDYMIFLSMMGHYFDNIYNYILSLPSQKILQSETSSSFNKMVTEQMLSVYGWKTEDDSDLVSLSEYYSTGSLNSNTDENRMRNIWNRILNNLPLIYKNKGTKECINILLSCYGIPSNYLTIKEYGGVDYSEDSEITYTHDEKRWMTRTKTNPISWFGSSIPYHTSYIRGPWPNNIETVEFKLSSNFNRDVGVYDGYGRNFYETSKEVPIFKAYQQYATDSWSVIYRYGSLIGTPYYDYILSTGSAYQEIFEIGLKADRGENMAKAYFRMFGGTFIERTGSITTGSQKSGTGINFTEPFTGSIPVIGVPVITQSRSGCYIETNSIPLLDGNIYNIMLRKNEPYFQFESSSVSSMQNEIPAQYDLIVQRNSDGRVAVKSSSSIILNSDNNYGWTRPGYFIWGTIPTYGFQGYIDKLNLWDVVISNKDFEDHVNNYDSYAYSGSEPHKHLWFRYSPEYPINLTDDNSLELASPPINRTDLSAFSEISNIRNESFYYTGWYTGNDIYKTSNVNNLSSSASHSIATQSRAYFSEYWDEHFNQYNTFDQRLVLYSPTAYSFLDSPVTGTYDNITCNYLTYSAYPYSFKEFDVSVTNTTPKYGPNRFKNEKIKQRNQSVEARLDPLSVSTKFNNAVISPDSNQIGFFADPQKWKNLDIVNYFGNINLVDELADPASLYLDNYSDLSIKRKQYRDSTINNTLFNEMLTIYKLYFDRSLFEIIKRMIPARSNALTGFLVESNILERPKYKHYPITSSITDFCNSTQLLSLVENNQIIPTSSLEWGNLNEPSSSLNDTLNNSMPANYKDTIDMSYISLVNKQFDINFGGNFIKDIDDLQFGQFAITDDLGRDGMIYQQNLNTDTKSSGSVYFLMKRWKKYKIYSRSLTTISDRQGFFDVDNYNTSSVYLYDLVSVSPNFLNSIAFTSSVLDEYKTGVLPSELGPPVLYKHNINTFRQTPNERINNLRIKSTDPIYTYKINSMEFDESSDTFFEFFNGFPRNHYTHGSMLFSPNSYPTIIQNTNTGSLFIKGKNSSDTTVSENGMSDGTYPIISIDVGNVNIVKSKGVLEI